MTSWAVWKESFQKQKWRKPYFSITICKIYLFYISWAFCLVLLTSLFIRHIPVTYLSKQLYKSRNYTFFAKKKTYFSITSLSIRFACWLSIFFSFDTFLAWSSVGSLGPFQLDVAEFFVVFFEDMLPGGTCR